MTRDSVPRPEYPRPQLRRDEWRTLNGRWAFEIDHGASGRARGLPEADALDSEITVPFAPESDLSGIGHADFMDAVWYRREIEIPERWFDGRVKLRFGAVDYTTEVWIDGESVGTHRGGYTPFGVDVTDVAEPGPTVVTVCAEDDSRSDLQPSGKQSQQYASHGPLYTRVTGVWQPVWLEPVPETYVESVRFEPDPENGALGVDVVLAGALQSGDVRATALFDGDAVGEAIAATDGRHAALRLDVDEVHRWRPEEPNLYDLELAFVTGGETVDTVESYFGLRSVTLGDDCVYVNGEPVFQRLVLDQGYYPDGLYTAPTDDALVRDIELAQEMGFNGARLHQKVFEPRFLYHADRLGYLVWDEHANWGLDHGRSEALGPFLQEWLEVVERDYNHPSVVGWTPFNETKPEQDEDLVRTVYRVTKALDPTRPVIDASGWVHVETDLVDAHDYEQDPEAFRETYGEIDGPVEPSGHGFADWSEELSYVSEYGGIRWSPDTDAEGWGYGDRPEDEAAFFERYRGLTETLLDNEQLWAFCYTQLYDVEQETNGLYTYDRRPKFDPGRIREINERPAAFERRS
ncbi:glycoside hydrolase family 2 protein [Halegenticoccus tardaugens]|uniref:glycoside hydrolase family 2 protein n=1 Tax=Halegenticoccus tardaugens TaxID=2071624 RepID=UPI00100A65BB|nr:sugar-binding domain-containing protein [Halegenticoccus tardaugens]